MWLNSWIAPPPPSPNKQHISLVSKFLNLAILIGEKMEKNSANSRKN